MSSFNRVSVLRRAVAISKGEKITKIDKPEDQKPVLEKAGIQVSNKDPKYGVFEHELGGQKIGHTVNVTGQGWTAVPAEGEIQGKFKKHMEAQQYLADNHVENTKKSLIEEAAANKPKVKKDDLGNDEEDLDDPDSDVEKSVARLVSAVSTVQKDWSDWNAAHQTNHSLKQNMKVSANGKSGAVASMSQGGKGQFVTVEHDDGSLARYHHSQVKATGGSRGLKGSNPNPTLDAHEVMAEKAETIANVFKSFLKG
jgi:hypothetical protein